MSKIIIGLTGEMASGKTMTASYLQEKHGAAVYRFSDILRDTLKRLHKENKRKNLQEVSTMFRTVFGEDALAKAIAEDVRADNNKIIAIDGVRRLGDIEHLKKIEGFRLVYIETDLEVCHQRISQRNEKIDDQGKTLSEFKKDRQREAEQQIGGLKKFSDFVINNNGTLDELYKQIDRLVK
jgi:dephospho-CoA kinase